MPSATPPRCDGSDSLAYDVSSPYITIFEAAFVNTAREQDAVRCSFVIDTFPIATMRLRSFVPSRNTNSRSACIWYCSSSTNTLRSKRMMPSLRS